MKKVHVQRKKLHLATINKYLGIQRLSLLFLIFNYTNTFLWLLLILNLLYNVHALSRSSIPNLYYLDFRERSFTRFLIIEYYIDVIKIFNNKLPISFIALHGHKNKKIFSFD